MPTLWDMTQISQPHVRFTTSEGGGGRFEYLSHVLDTYDVKKKNKNHETTSNRSNPKQKQSSISFYFICVRQTKKKRDIGGASTAKETVSRFRALVAGISKGVESSNILVHLTSYTGHTSKNTYFLSCSACRSGSIPILAFIFSVMSSLKSKNYDIKTTLSGCFRLPN